MEETFLNNIAPYIDHTNLKADTKECDIKRLCQDALEWGFASVCVNSSFVPLAASILKDTRVNVCSVVGFPLGACNTEAKLHEAVSAVKAGASEIDMVMNVSYLKDGFYDKVKNDIQSVRDAVKDSTLKVIIETCLLSDEEKIRACLLSVEAGADFVKTSTGFSTGGASLCDIVLMRKTVGNKAMIKASGGIRNFDFALSLMKAGADRIGASASIAICLEQIAQRR